MFGFWVFRYRVKYVLFSDVEKGRHLLTTIRRIIIWQKELLPCHIFKTFKTFKHPCFCYGKINIRVSSVTTLSRNKALIQKSRQIWICRTFECFKEKNPKSF